jgi:hypothetical protein
MHRTATDPRCVDVPAQLRYVWQGAAAAGQTVHFSQLLYPHPPSVKRPLSNAAGDPRNKDLLGTAGADAIKVLADNEATLMLRCRFQPEQTEWIVCNPAGATVEAGGLSTDAKAAYLDVVSGKAAAISAVGATFLTRDGTDLVRSDQRRDIDQ